MNKEYLIALYHQTLVELALENEGVCVGADGTLVLLGLKKETDKLYLYVSDRVYSELKRDGCEETQLVGDSTFIKYGPNVEFWCYSKIFTETFTVNNVLAWSLNETIAYLLKRDEAEDREAIRLAMHDIQDLLVAKLPDNDAMHCDVCYKVITDHDKDLFHHTGIIDGHLNTHIHVCNECHVFSDAPMFNFDKYRIKQGYRMLGLPYNL